MVESATAQPIPKPSVPEFTVQFENSSIIIKIQNQRFDYPYSLYYAHTVRVKINSGQDWKIIERPIIRSADSTYVPDSSLESIYGIHIDGYTVLNYYWNGTNIRTMEGDLFFKSGDQVSFQVKASVGQVVDLPLQLGGIQYFNETSQWSDTQTITIPEIEATPAPSIDYSPFTVPVALVVVVIVLGACLVVYDFKKPITP